MRTWPIASASSRSMKLRNALRKKAMKSAEAVDLVVVFCEGNLEWLDDLTLPSRHRIWVYLKCSESNEHSFCTRFRCVDAFFLDVRDEEGRIQSSDECGGYLLHIEQQFEDLSDWTIFLQDDAPRHLHLAYLNLVLKLIAFGSFSSLAGKFLHLNNDRHLLYWTPCLQSLLEFLDLPSSGHLFATYCCAQFVVHRSQITQRGLGFFQKASRLLKKNLEDIAGCKYKETSQGRRLPGFKLDGIQKEHERAANATESSTFQMRLCHLYDSSTVKR